MSLCRCVCVSVSDIPCSYYIGNFLVYMLIVSAFRTTPLKASVYCNSVLETVCMSVWCVGVFVVCVWYVLTTHKVQGPILRINGDHVSILHQCNGTTIIRLRSYMTDHDTWRKKQKNSTIIIVQWILPKRASWLEVFSFQW